MVLFLFVYLTFKAVEFQVAHLLELGVGGQVEGLDEDGDEGTSPAHGR